METEGNRIFVSKNKIEFFTSDRGDGSNVVFSRESSPLVSNDSRRSGVCSCSTKKLKSQMVVPYSETGKEDIGQERRLSRQDRIELGRSFQAAVSSHDWQLSENLILLADSQTLNDALCFTLDSIWFLTTQHELLGITTLIKNIIASGAYDFTRDALRTSFLALCVYACQSRTMSLADTVTVMAQRRWNMSPGLHCSTRSSFNVTIMLRSFGFPSFLYYTTVGPQIWTSILRDFMKTSSIVEYKGRLQLLLAFHGHISAVICLELEHCLSVRHKRNQQILYNVFGYYVQFYEYITSSESLLGLKLAHMPTFACASLLLNKYGGARRRQGGEEARKGRKPIL